MWKRKELKIKAKNVIKKNYWTAIIVCFIIALLTGEFRNSTVGIWQEGDSIDPNYVMKQENLVANNEVAQEKIEDEKKNEEKLNTKKSELSDTQLKILEMVKANLNNMTKKQKYLFRIWDSIELFKIKETGLGVGFILIALIAIAYIIIRAEPLIVSSKKYFLEARKKENTKMGVMKEIFKRGNWKNVAKIMFLKDIYNLLWYLTIIGGFIKSYEYRMIPYILADNPKIERKEAFRISKEMMRHNKWKTFILDLSFLLWDLLSLFTFGILNILYVNPYKAATVTELYVTLKNKDIEKQQENEVKNIDKV